MGRKGKKSKELQRKCLEFSSKIVEILKKHNKKVFSINGEDAIHINIEKIINYSQTMKYTHNWNQQFIQNSSGLKNLNLCLEIGCFEGLTSNYICDKLLAENGKLICVDPLTDNYLNDNLTEEDKKNNETIYKYFSRQHERFVSNTKKHMDSGRLVLKQNLSLNAFPELIKEYSNQFDLIYIDGDHRASAVYIDAINCFELCKPGGVIIFDDYSWGKKLYNKEATKHGIDKFLKEYEGQYEILIKGYQISIKKQ